ncbi:hypothetical protein B296_00055362 [Ensete ventricosum]|uniref:DNA2/NAM7 helicase helicase domain-containing protein n=1 Tax=Ensete ventricosum TaxID=4639 RepID=A0A426XQX7_ENSVE|nr:hypothetical protein B296_00055362 [Ensete ventricosum]
MLSHSLPCRHAWRTGGEGCACRWGEADLTCARSAVRLLTFFVQSVDQSHRVGHVSSPDVRGCDNLTARSTSVVSLFLWKRRLPGTHLPVQAASSSSYELDVSSPPASSSSYEHEFITAAVIAIQGIDFRRCLSNLNLNQSQTDAILSCISARQCRKKKSINLIWGPPGTGKTKTISGLVWLLDLLSCRTLICAPTNTAVKEVALRLLKLVKQFSGNSRCRLGDVVLCGNEQRMRINDGLQDVFLDFRVKRIQESFAQKTGWKHCLSSMLEFFEDGVSLYRKFLHGRKVSEGDKDISEEKEVGYDDKMFSVDKLGNDVEDFLSFARRKFRVLSKQICSCFEMLYLHIPRAALSESNCKVFLILFDLLKEFDKLLFKVDAGSKLEEIFRSRAEKVEDSSSKEMLDFGAATSFMVRRTRASCCETLRALERSLKQLPSISSKGPMYGPYSFINIGHGRESLDSLGRSRKNEVEIVVILQILRNLHKDIAFGLWVMDQP